MKEKEKKKDKGINIGDNLLKQRKIFLYDVIDMNLAKRIVKKLYVLDQENNNVIQMRINSPGGSISAGIAIIDAMKDIDSPIITYVSGEACSMAAFISICGDQRLMTRNSIWMGHPPSGGGSNDYFSFQKDRMDMIELREKMVTRILKEHTKLTGKEIEAMNHGELWYNASTCRKKGIVDKVKRL